MIIFALIVVIVAVATIFSVQNAVPVTLSFFAWRFSASLAVLVFLSILTGILIAALFSLSMRVRKSLAAKGRLAGPEMSAGQQTTAHLRDKSIRPEA